MQRLIPLVAFILFAPCYAQQQGQATLRERFDRLDTNGNGKLEADELNRPDWIAAGDTNDDGSLSFEEVSAYFRARQGAGRQQRGGRNAQPIELRAPNTEAPSPDGWTGPPLKQMPESDATGDAAGTRQLFESVIVENITDVRYGTNGFALGDLNGDGLLDIVSTHSLPRGSGGIWGEAEKLRVHINEGNFRFREHQVTLKECDLTPEAFGRGQVPVLADFNRDGLLDIFVTRHAPMQAGENRRNRPTPGNSLLLADGAWDTYRDISEKMGIRNEVAYNRQPSLGDVNRDGWLDIAIGCDNIGNAMGGVPHSRLYIYRPAGDSFEGGAFEDIGGTELVPDFGGFYHDSERDKAGPDINLRDLDNDGDLDLLQTCHADVREPLLPYSPGEYRQGVFCWKNLLAETGELRFEKLTDNGLSVEAKLTYDREQQIYVADGTAPGLPYVSFADVDNDGLLDIFVTGPSDHTWSPRAEYVGGRFWQNLGGLTFREHTEAAGLQIINSTYRQWYEFFDAPIADFHANWQAPARSPMSQPGLEPTNPIDNRPYYSDAVFGDFDNDGWQDLVVLDRRQARSLVTRAVLLINQRDGSFEAQPTDISGLDAGGISGEAADLNNDGLLDLIIAADPDNSGSSRDPGRYEDKVYFNTGLHGARENHWLRLRFTGVSDAELIGARVNAYPAATPGDANRKPFATRAIAADHCYKSGSPLEAHIGLGTLAVVDIEIVLLSGDTCLLQELRSDAFYSVDLPAAIATVVVVFG